MLTIGRQETASIIEIIEGRVLVFDDKPGYNTYYVDSSGQIWNTVSSETLEGTRRAGQNIHDSVDIKTFARYLWALKRALRTRAPVGITYRVQQIKFSALFEPLNSSLARVHELKATDSETTRNIIRMKKILSANDRGVCRRDA